VSIIDVIGFSYVSGGLTSEKIWMCENVHCNPADRIKRTE